MDTHRKPASGRPDPDSAHPSLRIIAALRTASWGIIDFRRTADRHCPTDAGREAVEHVLDTLLTALEDAERIAVHAYNHEAWGQCPASYLQQERSAARQGERSASTSLRNGVPPDDFEGIAGTLPIP